MEEGGLGPLKWLWESVQALVTVNPLLDTYAIMILVCMCTWMVHTMDKNTYPSSAFVSVIVLCGSAKT